MKRASLFICLSLTLFILFSCNRDEQVSRVTDITGVVQKGPFINGTMIRIQELNNNLVETGRSFTALVKDDFGNFEVKSIELSSTYVELFADGYYYNESLGAMSNAPLTLAAITDLTSQKNCNVNTLTHLIKSRIQYLTTQSMAYERAKKQAESEVVKIFKLDSIPVNQFESLDITKNTESNAAMLAISLILQGKTATGDLSKLLADISSDIEKDGKLDNAELKNRLLNNAKGLSYSVIRKNLMSKYQNRPDKIVIPNFEKYIDLYLKLNGLLQPTLVVEFPELGEFGKNLLRMTENNKLTKSLTYSLAATFGPYTPPSSANNIAPGYIYLSVTADTAAGKVFIDKTKAKSWQIVIKFPYLYMTCYPTIQKADVPVTFTGKGTLKMEMKIMRFDKLELIYKTFTWE